MSADEPGPEPHHRDGHALAFFAEVRAVLDVAPSGGDSLNARNPETPVRTMPFAPERQGLVTHLLRDDERRVDVLDVLWLN